MNVTKGRGEGQIGIREGRGYFKFYKIHEFYNLFWLRSLDYHLSTIELHYCLRNVSILLRNTRRVENKTGWVRGLPYKIFGTFLPSNHPPV